MAAPTVPTSGVRATFVLDHSDGDRAHYRIEILLSGPTLVEVEATLERGASPVFEGGDPLPQWVVDILSAIARPMSKGAKWPRRVTRWRPEPEPKEGP